MAAKAETKRERGTVSYTEESPEYGTLTFYEPAPMEPETGQTVQPNVLEASPSDSVAKSEGDMDGDIKENAPAAQSAPHQQVMAARQYIDSLGLGDIVDWDNESGTVNIGGVPIRPAYVTGGIAYVPKYQLDAAAEAYKLRAGLSTPQEIYKDYSRDHGSARKSALDKLQSREEFSYSTEADPVYQAYRDHYTQAANAALAQILNANNSSLYGASGAVLSEAFAARDAELRALDNKLPELYAAAYERYKDETKRLRDNYSDIRTEANDAYTQAREMSNDAWDRARAERQDYYSEQQRQYENERQHENDILARAAQRLAMEGQISENRSLAAQADMDERYAGMYPEFLAAELAARQLENAASERELDTDAQVRELARQAYLKSYYGKRGSIDGILGLYRGW